MFSPCPAKRRASDKDLPVHGLHPENTFWKKLFVKLTIIWNHFVSLSEVGY